ncbi:MAG: hypothetical protein DCF16_18035 [Alphaproteobacteria bacterium]|nr:MAG: hypothetical protein DCF16_18035 [Alphaproteobacteria bacterium]
MPSARTIMRGSALNARFGVNGIQKASSEFGVGMGAVSCATAFGATASEKSHRHPGHAKRDPGPRAARAAL